jgi:hypothetical protein
MAFSSIKYLSEVKHKKMFQKYIFLFALGFLFVVGSVDANDLQCFVDGECTNSLHIDSALVEDEVKC